MASRGEAWQSSDDEDDEDDDGDDGGGGGGGVGGGGDDGDDDIDGAAGGASSSRAGADGSRGLDSGLEAKVKVEAADAATSGGGDPTSGEPGGDVTKVKAGEEPRAAGCS